MCELSYDELTDADKCRIQVIKLHDFLKLSYR